MTIYKKYTPNEIEAMADNLKQQLSDGILPEDVLESYKFRGPVGKTWTVIPETGAWYCFQSGSWQPAEAPDTTVDGTVDLLDLVVLPLDPLENDQPEENEPAQQDADIRQMLERATRRVKESYSKGEINSSGAEILLKDLYLLDPVGVIWSYGYHSEEWYYFRQDEWKISTDGGPNPLDFQTQSDSPKHCSNCDTLLSGGKFCSECGTPVSAPESSYTQAAQEVVERFTESDVASLPEKIVPDWKPAPGFPGTIASGAVTPEAAKKSSQEPQWKLRITQGVGADQSFALGSQTRLGRKDENEILLADPQSSPLHALIQRQENVYVITDQNSTNGTFVNGVRIKSPTRLHPGDTLSIGETKLILEGEETAPAAAEKEGSPRALRSPGTDPQAPSAPTPKKRKRMLILLVISILVVTCMCCSILGLVSMFNW